MSIAAVPSYLEKDFTPASPGMRFGMYLPIWSNRQDQEQEVNKWAQGRSDDAKEIRRIRDEEGMDAAIAHAMSRRKSFPRLWDKNPYAANRSWKQVIRLNEDDLDRMKGFRQRQRALAAAKQDDVLALDARSAAPFTTGLGNEHPLENGFAFLWPYGLPYLPGSGVKGVIRQAARELASGEWGESHGWSTEKRFEIKAGKQTLQLSTIDLLLGLESEDRQKEHFRGVLSFWDVMPEISGKQLMVEIMTPHQKHYYQEGQPPHDCGQPVPIHFLTVPPGSAFTFHVVCDRSRLQRIAPALMEEENGRTRWRLLLEAAFKHAFDWLGFGAKTAVGYGAMKTKTESTAQGASPPSIQSKEMIWPAATLKLNPGTGEITAIFQGQKTAPLKGAEAEALRAALAPNQQQRLKKKKELKGVAVRVKSEGNLLELMGLK